MNSSQNANSYELNGNDQRLFTFEQIVDRIIVNSATIRSAGRRELQIIRQETRVVC
jgi:hypothetical protein